MNDQLVFDEAGRPIEPEDLQTGDATLFDAGALRDAQGHLLQSLQDVAQVGQSMTNSVGTVASLFDGTKTVQVGNVSAPVGLVMLGGLAALLLYNRNR